MAVSRLTRICSTTFLFKLFRNFFFMFSVLYLLELGFSGIEVGILFATLTITLLLSELPIGIISDKLDIRKTMALSNILFITFLYLISITNQFLIFIPLFILGGFSLALNDVSFRSYIFKDKEPWHEGKKYGEFTFSEILAAAGGSLLGMLLVSGFGFSITFLLIGMYYLVITPLVYFLEPMKIKKTKLVQYKKDFFHLNNILLAVVLFLFSSHWGAESTSYTPFLREVLGLSYIQSGLFVALSIIPLGLFAYFFGQRMDKKADYKSLFLYGMVISGLFHVLMTVPQINISFMFRVMHEIGDGMAMVAIYFWLGRKFKKSRIGGDSGIFFMLMTLGSFVGALVYGPIGATYGFQWPLIISGLIALIAAGLFLVLKRRL